MANRLSGPFLNREVDRGSRQWYSNLPQSQDPNYCVYFNDFLVAQDYAASDWVITTTEAGAGDASEALAADEACGALLITNDAADDDSDSLQGTEETWRLTSGKQLWFDCRAKVSDADQCDLFLGLGITDTTPLDTSDRIGFQINDGNASILCKSEKNSTESSDDSAVDAADGTYVRLSFHYNGAGKVEFFVDNALVATHTSNIPDDENLCLTMHLVNGEAVAKTLTVDYLYVAQER